MGRKESEELKQQIFSYRIEEIEENCDLTDLLADQNNYYGA